MSKEVINIGGEQRIVREDTAKSYRGVYWALFSILGFIIIAAIMFFGGFLNMATSGTLDRSPAENERQANR